MTDAPADLSEEDGTPPKSGRLGLILGVVLALAGGGGGYFAVAAGLLPFGAAPKSEPAGHGPEHDAVPPPLPEIAYVPVGPILVTLDRGAQIEHLRFRGELEVAAAYREEVESVLPRVFDVLNGYLRALEAHDLADPLALARLRAQMLRRVQIVTGQGRVRDLLIMDFVLN